MAAARLGMGMEGILLLIVSSFGFLGKLSSIPSLYFIHFNSIDFDSRALNIWVESSTYCQTDDAKYKLWNILKN